MVIKATNLSKRFYLGESNQHTFIEDVWHRAGTLCAQTSRYRQGDTPDRKHPREFWALKNVDLEIQHGQTLAVIGANGSGKSTLLKILSRITQPTTGELAVYGRVASLLEVGTGFHPEFTGKENIYLNGAILGLSRREINARYQQIVDFAEIGDFISEPVKRYSSGMYVRLAFASAAFLNPEIMILDEVLAVGDMLFQQKCLSRVQEIMREGHAAIMVSHSMHAVRQMADVCLWLRAGEVAMFGPAEVVTSAYEREMIHQERPVDYSKFTHLEGWSVRSKGSPEWRHYLDNRAEEIELSLRLIFNSQLLDAAVQIAISDSQGILILCEQKHLGECPVGRTTLILKIPGLPVRPGPYRVTCTIFQHGQAIAQSQGDPELTLTAESATGTIQGLLHLPADLSFTHQPA